MRIILVGLTLAAAAIASIATGARAADSFQLLRLDSHLVKWGQPKMGTGAEVSYSIVAAPRASSGARNCRNLQPMDALLARSGIARADFVGEVEAAFAMWQTAADITFRASADPATADILIGAHAGRTGPAFANVEYSSTVPASTGRTDIRTIRQSLVCLHAERQWKIGFDGNTSVYDLRYALAHEIGHAIGLDHPGPHGQLMAFSYKEQFRGLQAGDVAGIVALYGAAKEERPMVASVGRPKINLDSITPVAQPLR